MKKMLDFYAAEQKNVGKAAQEMLTFTNGLLNKYGADVAMACLTGAFDLLEIRTGKPAEELAQFAADAIRERKAKEVQG